MLARIAPIVCFLLLCCLLFTVLISSPRVAPVSQIVGQKVPSITLEKVDLEQAGAPMPRLPLALPTGSGYLITFFASWCGPCKMEMPELARLQKQYGVPVIGVAWQDSPTTLRIMHHTTPLPYRSVLLDAKGEAALAFGLLGVPESYMVDAEGVIRGHYIGMLMPHDIDTIGHQLSTPAGHAR